jgi:hypothetical protein
VWLSRGRNGVGKPKQWRQSGLLEGVRWSGFRRGSGRWRAPHGRGAGGGLGGARSESRGGSGRPAGVR